MLICELLTREPDLRVSGYELSNTHHIFQRAHERGINRAIIISLLKRIGRARKAIEEYGETLGVRLWDSQNRVYIISYKIPDTAILKLVTVHGHDDADPPRTLMPTVKLR